MAWLLNKCVAYFKATDDHAFWHVDTVHDVIKALLCDKKRWRAFCSPHLGSRTEQILVSEFYHNENQNKKASFSEKAWRFLHVNINVLKINEKGGDACFFFFFPEYSSYDFASFKASMSSTSL